MKFSGLQITQAEGELVKALGPCYKTSDLVGSTYILGEGQDMDFAVLVSCIADGMEALDLAGYKYTGGCSGEEDDFFTLRKGDVNVILTADEDFFDNFMSASEICKALQLTSKWQRVAVHRIIMNDEDAETAVSVAKALYPS